MSRVPAHARPMREAAALYGAAVAYPPLPTADEVAALLGRRALKVPPTADVNLAVPFAHQLWDTPDEFNGQWACGALAAVMVLAYLRLVEPHPITVSQPTPHTSDFGWYVCNVFEQGSARFDASADTPTGRAQGIYGTTLDDHPGVGWCTGPFRTRFAPSPMDRGLDALFAAFLPSATPGQFMGGPKRSDKPRFLRRDAAERTLKAHLDAGHPVITSGFFQARYDHLIVVRGYYAEPGTGELHWIVNDPYGFETDQSFDGENVVYTFHEINPKWLYAVVV